LFTVKVAAMVEAAAAAAAAAAVVAADEVEVSNASAEVTRHVEFSHVVVAIISDEIKTMQ